MATFVFTDLATVRGCLQAMIGQGVVWADATLPARGSVGVFSRTLGGNTYQFWPGAQGVTTVPWGGGLGIIGDMKAWSGFRCATAISQSWWTTVAEDNEVANVGSFNINTGNTRGALQIISKDDSVDGSVFNYDLVKFIGFYTPALGSWNYICTSEGGAATGSIALGGMSLDSANIQALAEAIAGMIQIINNVTVGSDLLEAMSSIQTSLELLNTALGADGFADSFDAAMDLLIDKFGETGPFATLAADLQAIRDALGPTGTAGDILSQITEVVAALGAGGILGALGAGGSVGAALSNLSPIMGAITSIGSVANAIAQFQQSDQMANIANAVNNASGQVSNLSNATSTGLQLLRDRIAQPGQIALGDQLASSVASVNGNLSTIAVRLNSIDGRLVADIGGTTFDVVEAIATFCGGGGGTTTVDFSPIVAKLEEIRQAMGGGTLNFDMDRLKEILDSYFLTTQNGETFNLAYLIISLLNTGWIVYK